MSQHIVARYKAVFTEPPGKIPSDTATDAPLLGNGDMGIAIGGPPECQRYWIAKNDFWKLRSQFNSGGARLFGVLRLAAPQMQGASYRVEQDLHSAATHSCFSNGGMTLRMRSWVAATANVLAVEAEAEGAPIRISASLEPGKSHDSISASGRDGSALWIRRGFEDNVDIPVAAACALLIIGRGGAAFDVEPGSPVRLIVAMASSFEAPDCLRSAMELAGRQSARLESLWDEHITWWQRYWDMSAVEIGDPVIEQRYHLSNYVMASASRNPEHPPSIFGTWVTTDTPAWSGDYHLNYNHQAPCYGLYSSNHVEQADPFDAPCLAFMERGRWYAENLQGCRGIYYPVGIGPKGIETTRANPPRVSCLTDGQGLFHGQKSNAAYCAANMAMRWYHTHETAYARRVYPFVRAVAAFWEDYMDVEGSRYVIRNDSIHEGSTAGMDFNPLLSLGLVRMVMRLALDMSEALGADLERREKWRHILGHISAFPTQQRDGKTVFRYSERGMDWCDSNTLGIQHIYPAGEIGLESDPELLAIAKNTVSALNGWRDFNGMSSFYPAAVRVGLDPELILREMKAMIEALGLPNGFTRNNPHGIENCSVVPSAINEMLCMGHQRVLRFFPVWPKLDDAAFRDLRVPGAFLVSGEMCQGEAMNILIRSEQGRTCTVDNPWGCRGVRVHRDDKPAEPVKGRRFDLRTRKGESIRLVPDGR